MTNAPDHIENEPRQPAAGGREPLPDARRIAVVLHADVVGYTRLVADGEAAALAKLEERRAVLRFSAARCNGSVVDMTGDGALIRFASAAEAVSFAVDAQDEIARLNEGLGDGSMAFRMGIASGDVVERDGALAGECVNIAARLQALAKPGGFCVSRQIYEQVAGKMALRFRDLGPVSLKNVAVPIQAFAVSRDDGRRQLPVPAAARPARRLRQAAAVAAALCLTAAALWLVGGFRSTGIAPPPLPSLRERDGPFDPTRLPFLLEPGRGEAAEAFRRAAAPKALAIDAQGRLHSTDRAASERAAVDAALSRCRAAAGANCLLLAIDDTFAVRLPRSHRALGVWDHRADLDLTPSIREHVGAALQAGVAAFALAKGDGAVGFAAGSQGEGELVARAVEACTRQGNGCRPYALGPFVIEPR